MTATPTLLDQVRNRFPRSDKDIPVRATTPDEIMLVSSPGYGVIDSGCGRTVIGATTLLSFEQLWRQQGWVVPQRVSELHQFKFGNGDIETSHFSVQMPVTLANRKGVIRAAVIRGDAPLLLSRSALKSLGASLDFQHDCLQVFGQTIPLKVNEAGQYVVNLISPKESKESEVSAASFSEVMSLVPAGDPEETVDPTPPTVDDAEASLAEAAAEPMRSIWTQENCDVCVTPWLSKSGPAWKKVIRRRVFDHDTNQLLDDSPINPGTAQHKTMVRLKHRVPHVRTEFEYLGEPIPDEGLWSPTPHQVRQLESQFKTCLAVHSVHPHEKCLVMEVFSPPRFALEANQCKRRARSYDLMNGYDFRRASCRKSVEQDLLQDPPELLVLCPPCTHEGGWFNLNRSHWNRFTVLKLQAQSRSYIRWCCRLFRMGVQLGCRVVFEHPTGARTWSYPEVQSLCRRFTTVKLHMCRYGMKLPKSERFIRKSTRLLVSHADMESLGLRCDHQGTHACHDTIAGGAPGVPSISTFAGAYPRPFVQAVLKTVNQRRSHVGGEHDHEADVGHPIMVVEDLVPPDRWTEILAASSVSDKSDRELIPVLDKLHRNLGHPPNHDLVRILKHGQASEQALRLAKEFSCDLCRSQLKPKIPLPSQPNRVSEFNQQVGLDVKHLTGWLPNQRVKALNIVDTASSFQRIIPFFETETSSVLRKLFSDHWISWAGTPKEIVLDPARTNLGDPMVIPAELEGTQIRPIAAGAHWQLGKCETHGGWFNRVLERLLDEFSPTTKEQWLECVSHCHIKNQQLQVHGYSPHQFVFGKNPHIPQDLLSEPLQIVPATASLTDEALAKSQAMRVAARVALTKMQDDRALRVALLARPRKTVVFNPGDLVAYWRNQKWVQGQLHQGGQWYGTAVVLGQVGRNLVIVHRRQIIRCAPEQVRHATNEEKCLITAPGAELLGIKDMIEKGNLMSKQYIDLLPQSYPPQEGNVEPPSPAKQETVVAPQDVPMPADLELAVPVKTPEMDVNQKVQTESSTEPSGESSSSDQKSSTVIGTRAQGESEAARELEVSAKSSYGPVRRRVEGKDGPMTLWRPPAMRQADFVDIMKEVVPKLVEDASMSQHKRPASPSNEEPPTAKPRMTESLSVEDVTDLLSAQDVSWECLMSEYLKKKMSKEIHHSNNPPELQCKVQEGKRTEWETILNKPNSVRVHYGAKAREIERTQAHRFIGSRFVLTRKPLEEGQDVDPNNVETFSVKGRWCLQGHLDPDLSHNAEMGLLKSPTLSQLGRTCLMQTIASMQWQLQLGDIKGAFLEAGPLNDAFRPLFARQPPGGIPGLPADAVIEVLGNVYGQNDAPAAWFKEFSSFLKENGWYPSVLDPCLFMLRDGQNHLVGVMGVHVDDTAVGGSGDMFNQSIKKLRTRFPYRKWRIQTGEFCGAWYHQLDDMSIHMDMSAFAGKIRPINVPKTSKADELLSDSQVKVLRAVNGSLGWLSSQSRPDLCVQTSLAQQAFPKPKIEDFRMANQAVRRAKQHDKLGITFKAIRPRNLTLVCHSDAAFANRGNHTQAGYIIGFTDKSLQEGHESPWCPASWKSFKLQRAVSSTMSAESQALAIATGTTEWILLLLAEIFDGPLDVRTCRDVLKRRRPIVVTDCKSLYDHLQSPSSPTSIEDRRTSIDVVIIRESCRSMSAHIRWVPTNRMLADALTKNDGDPVDLLRSCMKRSMYQISPEETVLKHQAREKEHRKQLQLARSGKSANHSHEDEGNACHEASL